MFKNVLILFVLLLVVFLVGCSAKNKIPVVDFKKTLEIQDLDRKEVSEINMGVGSMITPEEGYAYYKELLEYVGKKLGRRVNFMERKSYQEVNDLLKNGVIDVAFVCGGPYVEGREKFGLKLLVAPQVGGKTTYFSYIIVRKDSPIRSFAALRGRTFAFVDPLSNSGRLAPIYRLAMIGERAESFFSETVYSYDHDKSIMAVALGVVEAAAVDSLIWEYLNKSRSKYTAQTKVIEVLGPYGIPPVVVRPDLETGLEIQIKKILLNMHEDREGKEILKGMGIDKFATVSDSNYNSIRKIKAALNL